MSPKINRYFTKTIKKVRQRVWGYKVRSGRTLTDTMSKAGPVLPNKQNPVVVRVVTRSELAAIPKDRYNVKVIKAMVPSQKTGEPGVEEELLVAISYALACLAGAAVCTFLWNVSPLWSMIAGAVTVIVIRLLAAHFRWSLPKAKE